jgi:DNA-binding protein H-NS
MTIDMLAVLNNRAHLRRTLKDTHTDELEKIIERLQFIHVEKLKEKQAAVAQRAAKNQAKEDVLALMAEKGLDITDFVTLPSEQKKATPGKKAPPKLFLYRWKEGIHTYEYQGLNLGLISTKAKNGERFAKYLKKTNKKRSEFIVGAAD